LARNNSLLDAPTLFGVLVGGSVVYEMDTNSTGEAKVTLIIASPARRESMLAGVFAATWMLK
jgi:hypothetical protein